ncbi:hypothetical protein GTO91_16870 [Heliobacterium undosum]|uniref:AAA+ ATPase domain-containing protein n=2 Tax=Heliomicrobium undosum TaxID=121734 RepID=A0A845L9B6_9FIRM|nr:hypothetical protein [Heliomicrobium undosum]
MSFSERLQQFENLVKEDPLFNNNTWSASELFGVSNSSKIIAGGMFVGNSNLENFIRNQRQGILFLSEITFPPEDEVFFAVFVHNQIGSLRDKLNRMTELFQTEPENYAQRNNNVKVYLDAIGRIFLKNKGFWNTLKQEDGFDSDAAGPFATVDKIVYAMYPPAATAQRSSTAREFVGYLTGIVGQDRIHEVFPWPDEDTIAPEMHRMPSTIPVRDIVEAVSTLGGYYTDNLVERYHIALNHLERKHFVILAGLSGTGKTSIARKYSQAVHGITDPCRRDPLFFVCPVRPDWTDPTGLTGYYDVISNRYIVQPFLQAVLTASNHPECPVFVCLDEMNLAKVEYYFADVLSALESGEELSLHSNVVPIEGSNGARIPASIPIPNNLFITGTINVDETTQRISDKVLDRAVVLDMSAVDLEGFLEVLQQRHIDLRESVQACSAILSEVNGTIVVHGLGFGYRVAEEFIRYHRFAVETCGLDSDDVIDQQISQKVLTKLRGTEQQREMLNSLRTLFERFRRSQGVILRLLDELNQLGSFQNSR